MSGGSITGVFGSNGAQSVLGGLTVVSVTSQALEPEIAVEQPAGTDITSGGSRGFGTVTLGSNTSLEFTIKNTGTSALNLTGTPPDHVVVGGTNPGDFTVTSQPSTPVSSGGGTTTFTVQFAPGAAGARSATLTIANDDPTGGENPFVINLSGTGGTGTIQIVNIDFNGTRNGDGNPTTFTGLGAVTNGGGTVFNGLLADSQGSPENDALTVGGSNLRDEFNTLTTVGFTIGPVGGDTLTGDNLTKDYIFVNSAGSSTDATFTISGLGAGTADLYFQLGSVGPGSGAGVFITGSTPTAGFSGNGHSWLFFNDVPITGGSITGTLGNPDFNPGPDNGDVVTLTGMTIVSGTGQTAYQAWATGSESFNGDANGDGVQDGLAFLLGAATPGTNATGLLPTVSKNGTGLVMTFDCLSAANRGTAVLNLQHSGDLGLTDAWAAALVPSTEPLTVTVSGVDFVTTANGALIHVVATIPSSGNDLAGKLFGRLKASETP